MTTTRATSGGAMLVGPAAMTSGADGDVSELHALPAYPMLKG
jgi:hypothetical protein